MMLIVRFILIKILVFIYVKEKLIKVFNSKRKSKNTIESCKKI